MNPEEIKTVEDVKLWIAGFQERMGAWWENQRTWNAKQERRNEEIFQRLSALEKRIGAIAGICAAVGAVIGGPVGAAIAQMLK